MAFVDANVITVQEVGESETLKHLQCHPYEVLTANELPANKCYGKKIVARQDLSIACRNQSNDGCTLREAAV